MNDTHINNPVINLSALNNLFNHRTRMGIMAILMVNEWVDFVALRNALELTDGSLASHLKTLVNTRQIEVRKRPASEKPKTSYRATPTGRTAFETHLAELEAFIRRID